MPNFNRQAARYYVDPPILANTEGNFATEHVTVSRTNVTVNNEGFKAVPAGLFVASLGNVLRFLPRVKTVTASATGSPSFNVGASYQTLVAGDVLHVLEPYAVLTITASSATQTQTITINGITATATATSSTVATTASEVATVINNHAYLSTIVYALTAAGTVWIFSRDGATNWGITEGGTVTATLSGSTLVPNTTAIGTISSITPIDGVSATVTLTGNASVALPIGVNVGVLGAKIHGLHIHSVDFTEYATKDLSLYTVSNAVRTQHLPYFDGNIVEAFKGRMYFDVKF